MLLQNKNHHVTSSLQEKSCSKAFIEDLSDSEQESPNYSQRV